MNTEREMYYLLPQRIEEKLMVPGIEEVKSSNRATATHNNIAQ
jgi:hypothetical protein